MKEALLFITTEKLNPALIAHNIIEHRYFIYLSDFMIDYTTLAKKLAPYSTIYVIIIIDAIKSEKGYCYPQDETKLRGSPKKLLKKIIMLNKYAKYYIISVSCYGFYIHEYAFLLPKQSALLNISDYVSMTSQFNLFYDYCNNERNNINLSSLLLYYFQETLFYVLPHIFITYRNNLDNLKITSLFHYIPTKFEVNPFYNAPTLTDIYNIIKQHYNVPLNLIISENMIYHLFNTRYYDDIYPPFHYKDAYTIVDNINKLLSMKKSVRKYFKILNSRRYLHDKRFQTVYKYPRTCKLEIIEFLQSTLISKK